MVEKEVDGTQYEIVHESGEVILKVDCNKWIHTPSIEDNSIVMARTLDMIAENLNVSKIIFNQKRDFEYDQNQTQLLVDLAKLYNFLSNLPKPEQREDMKIGAIHYICEEFDNSEPEGLSKRVAWLKIFDWPKNLYAKSFGKKKQVFTKVSGKSSIA